MVTSNNGIAFIKQCEGCHLEAYKLKGEKYYTIGYGHTFDDKIKHDTKWTLEQAHKALVKDLEQPEFYVNQIALSKLAISVLLMRITNSELPRVHLTMNTNLVIRKSFN